MSRGDQETPPHEGRSKIGSWLVCLALMKLLFSMGVVFFASYPAYQKLFGEFADVPHDELVENGKFKAHAFTLVNLLNGLVENVDDPELFSYVLVKQGKNHAQHSLKASDFENMKTSLLDFFRKTGNVWTAEADVAWSKLLSMVVARAAEGLRAAAREFAA